MGDISDMMYECAIQLEIEEAKEQEDLDRRLEEKIWTTEEGQKIPLNEMSDEHIKNCISYFSRKRLVNCERTETRLKKWKTVWKDELKRRGYTDV